MLRARRPLLCLLPLLYLPLGGCLFGGLSSEDEQRLNDFQQNAAYYYDGQHFAQALDASRKGLEIDPDNYKLLSITGSCYYRLGDLRRANVALQRAYDQRAPADHQGHVLLFYGLTLQQLGREHARLALVERAKTNRVDLTETERTMASARAEEHQERAEAQWNQAERLFNELIDREELLRYAHKALMEVDVERGDYQGAVDNGEACLARNLDEQEVKRSIIRETMEARFERQERAALDELVDQEEKVRAALAEMHYRQGKYELAVEQLDILLTLDTTRSFDYYNRGRALEALGQDSETLRDYNNFLRTTDLPNDDPRVTHAAEYIRTQG